MANPIYSGQLKIAVRQALTWGTEIDVDEPNQAFKATEISAFTAIPEMLPDNAIGQPFKEYVRSGRINVNPAIVGDLYFDNSFWTFLATFMGLETNTPGTGFSLHELIMQPQSCKFQTVAMTDGTSDIVKVIPSHKTSSFVIAGEGAANYTWTVEGIGNDVLMPGLINTGLTTATIKDKVNIVPFGTTRLLINDQTAGALNPVADLYNPASLTLTLTRELEAQFNGNAAAIGEAANRTSEPLENGFPTIALAVRFPTLINNDRLDDLKAGDILKASIQMQGINIAGSAPVTPYLIAIQFPALRVTNVVHSGITERERVIEEVEFEALAAQAAPAGMTGTQPVRISVTNATITSYLATAP